MGETNANLSLNFQQEEADDKKLPRPESKKQRDGTPSRRHKSKSRESSPRKSIRSRTTTPVQELNGNNTLQPELANKKPSRSETMNTSSEGIGL